MEQYAPTQLKELIPQRWRIWLGYQIKVVRDRGVTQVDGLSRPVVLPPGETVESIKQYLSQNYVREDGENPERNNYLTEAFNRFVYTLELVPDGDGKLLELGASPYFITLLLKKYRRYELQFVNYFEPDPSGLQRDVKVLTEYVVKNLIGNQVLYERIQTVLRNEDGPANHYWRDFQQSLLKTLTTWQLIRSQTHPTSCDPPYPKPDAV